VHSIVPPAPWTDAQILISLGPVVNAPHTNTSACNCECSHHPLMAYSLPASAHQISLSQGFTLITSNRTASAAKRRVTHQYIPGIVPMLTFIARNVPH
jgi:hypothetical protein